MKYPLLIINKNTKEEFIHLGKGLYKSKNFIINKTKVLTPFLAFDSINFNFYYE